MAARGACALRPVSSRPYPVPTCPARRRWLGPGDYNRRTQPSPQPQNDSCWGAGDHRQGVSVAISRCLGHRTVSALGVSPNSSFSEPRAVPAYFWCCIPSITAPTDLSPPKPIKNTVIPREGAELRRRSHPWALWKLYSTLGCGSRTWTGLRMAPDEGLQTRPVAPLGCRREQQGAVRGKR